MSEDRDMAYEPEDDIDIQTQEQEYESPTADDLKENIETLKKLLEDLSEVLNGQRQQVLNLNNMLKDLPKEMDKLKNACAQAECTCQALPDKVKKDSLQIYDATLQKVQKNCNTFARQVDTWLKKREAKQDKALTREGKLLLGAVLFMILLQIAGFFRTH